MLPGNCMVNPAGLLPGKKVFQSLLDINKYNWTMISIDNDTSLLTHFVNFLPVSSCHICGASITSISSTFHWPFLVRLLNIVFTLKIVSGSTQQLVIPAYRRSPRWLHVPNPVTCRWGYHLCYIDLLLWTAHPSIYVDIRTGRWSRDARYGLYPHLKFIS